MSFPPSENDLPPAHVDDPVIDEPHPFIFDGGPPSECCNIGPVCDNTADEEDNHHGYILDYENATFSKVCSSKPFVSDCGVYEIEE
jgi:hypothetical protein